MDGYGKGKHDSKLGLFGGRVQKYTDPLSLILGDKYTSFVSQDLPREVNTGLSSVMKPFERIDKKVNPVRKISGVDKGMDEVAEHPGDALAAVAGAIFGGGALLGGGAAGGAGGAAGGGGAAGAGGGSSSLGGTLGFDGATTAAPSLGGGVSTSLNSGVTSAGSSGVGSAGGAPGSSGASGAGLSKFQDAMKLFQQQGSQSDEPQHRAEIYQQDPYLQSLMTSSKRAKTAAKGGAREAMDRGMSGDNPIDANGVQVLQIQQLTKQVAKLTKLVTQIERERARKG